MHGDWSFRLRVVSLMHQSIPAAPPSPPPPGYCGTLVRLFSPGGGTFANFAMPGDRTFANPGASPELLTLGFLSKYYYTEEFTGKTSRLAHLIGRSGWSWNSIDGCITSHSLTSYDIPLRSKMSAAHVYPSFSQP